MPTYEYQCESCGLKFERMQAMSDKPLTECVNCHGTVRRLISAGGGFIMNQKAGHGGSSCSLESTGRTCCGRDNRCGNASCDGHS